jgi:hypothetical protein
MAALPARDRLACAMQHASSMNRHVHRRPDGLAVICTRRRCALWQHRDTAWRVLLVTAPLLIAASSTLVAKNFGVVLTLVAVAVLLVWMTPNAVVADRAGRSRQFPSKMKPRAAPARTASSNRS